MSAEPETISTTSAQVVLDIPPGLPYQLVFRQERDWPLEASAVEGVTFHFCAYLRDWLRHSRLLRATLGTAGWAKGCLKMATPSRQFYFVADGSRVLHHAWVTLSHCRYYYVEKGSAVIGPIWTDPQARGRGIATFATASAVNVLLDSGHRISYIDTSNTNHPCLKVIGKCEYGAPIAAYIRSPTTNE
jgi:hypothetical protein